MTTDQDAFERALSEFRFTDAEQMLDAAADELRADLHDQLEERRREAEWQAQELHRRIIDLGAARSYPELLEIRDRGDTPALLDLLSDSARNRVDLFINNAERWAEGKRAANDRRLGQARRALDGLDLQLAAGVLARIEDGYLDDDAATRRDELLLDLSARRMELESLRAADARLTENDPPPDDRPWWRRWLE